MTEQRRRELGWCEEAQTYCSCNEEAYKQGREDAIEECKEEMKIAFIDVMRCLEGVIYPTSWIDWIDDVLEQLKGAEE